MTTQETLVEAFIEALLEEGYIDVSSGSFWERDEKTEEYVRRTDEDDYFTEDVERFCAAMAKHLPDRP